MAITVAEGHDPRPFFTVIFCVAFALPGPQHYFFVTLRVADTLVLLYSAEITTEVGRETRLVVTLKLADVAPAGTMTVDDTVAMFRLLLNNWITAPPEGAGPLSVTVPVEVEPPLTFAGLRVSAVSVGAVGTAVIHNVALTFELL